jgi:cysteinyl-tRNA synthetase
MARQLNLYNTALRGKVPFVLLREQAGMYCCGPTVYNYAHIGNLRTYIFEDVLKRTLKYFGYSVKHVMNITDVGHLTSDADTGDDKMENGALRDGKNVWELAEFYTQAFRRDLADLNICEPDIWTKATDNIPAMIRMVEELEKKGFTYTTSDGIYFDTAKFPTYADFAGIDVKNLQAGSRVDMGEKRSVTDFALWKFSPVDKKRQMEWDSPWGKGFPGWHIECSAMSLAYLPQPIDIHCGGMDHIRVHHTNEIAQAEASTGKPYVRYWLHGEFLVIDKGKMAKSGGNFVTLDTVKKQGLQPLAYRMFCFSAHYRSPLMFAWEGLKSAEQGLNNLKKLVAAETKKKAGTVVVSPENVNSLIAPFEDALCDDCNMPVALACVWNLLKDLKATAEEKYAAIEKIDSILGLDLFTGNSCEAFVNNIDIGDVCLKIIGSSDPGTQAVEQVVVMVRERKEAKMIKNFSKADEIRMKLKGMGVEIKDLSGGVIECSFK